MIAIDPAKTGRRMKKSTTSKPLVIVSRAESLRSRCCPLNGPSDAPQVRGTPIPRYRIFDKPTAVIVSSRGLGDTLRSAAVREE